MAQPEALPTEKWVRVYLGGQVVADSRSTLLLRAHGQLPVYYFPERDVRMARLSPAMDGAGIAKQGEGPWPEPPEHRQVFDVSSERGAAARAAWRVTEPPEGQEPIEGHFAFAWKAMDAWFEEDQPIRVHPHDPYHRIDVLPSSRHVRVELRGETVAETRRPVILFETCLPPRYYIPKVDVRMELLRPGNKETHCAYKGTATHDSLVVGGETIENVAWHYTFPNPGYELIQDLLAFYPDGVDGVFVDDRRLE